MMKVKYFFEVTSYVHSFRVHFACGGYDCNLFIPNDPNTVIADVTYFPEVDLWEFWHHADRDCKFIGDTREEAVENFLKYIGG